MPSLHVLPPYPLRVSEMLPLVKAIIAARQVVAAVTELELPEDLLSPTRIAADVRSDESTDLPIWIIDHDDPHVVAQAGATFSARYGDASLLYDYDYATNEASEILTPTVDAEESESDYTEDQFRTALVLLHQAKGNPLQAAANVAQLAPVSADPDDYMSVLAIFVDQFPWVYKGLVEAGVLSGADQ